MRAENGTSTTCWTRSRAATSRSRSTRSATTSASGSGCRTPRTRATTSSTPSRARRSTSACSRASAARRWPRRCARPGPSPPTGSSRAWPARKHDHFSIPAGTIHCSGRDNLVLEISATPYIFTFKLWDWGRVGLDGEPRPIHLEHGLANIQWDRTADWVAQNLVDRVSPVAAGDGWREESTGLHPLEFIATRRHWFTWAVEHDTAGTVNVLNLVEGAAAIVESPTDAFEPMAVQYAETFVVAAAVGAYRIRPVEAAPPSPLATIKAFVRSPVSR